MFIIRVLKLLLMQGKYILFALVVILLFAAPVAASLNKIVAGSPVFVGESDVDISAALNGCRVINWWPEGTSTSTPPQANLTIYKLGDAGEEMYRYNFTPDYFGNHTGTWYCGDKMPANPVFTVYQPEITIKVWDADADKEVTGDTLPISANITYRIDTNMVSALQYKYRPNINPEDGFYTVTLTDPTGKSIPSIYTGSAGAKNTQIIAFDSKPYISASPYYWKNGAAWDFSAKNPQGALLYPSGTYTFTVSQNLNHMQESYTGSTNVNTDGMTTSSASFAIYREVSTIPSTTAPRDTITSQPVQTAPVITSEIATTVPTTTPVPAKTTYAPLPAWVALFGSGLAAVIVLARNR